MTRPRTHTNPTESLPSERGSAMVNPMRTINFVKGHGTLNC